MPDRERFTIGRYKKTENMPRVLSSEGSGVIVEFTFVHPPNGDCALGGQNRGIRNEKYFGRDENSARVAAENAQILCDLCDKPYIPVLPKLDE